MSNQSYSQTTTYILVVIAAIIFGLLGYWYGSNNSGGFSTISVSDFIPQPEQSLTAGDIPNWKNYTSDIYGFSFKYPSNWQKPDFIENRNFGEPETAPVTWLTTEPVDTNKTFSFSSNTKDYSDYGGQQLTKPININWTQAEFEANSTIKPLVYKKMSEKALLIGYYSNVECSPSLVLEVVTPLSDKTYLNIHIFINGKFDQDQIIKDKDKQNIKEGKDSCDMEAEFKQIANQVQDGTYSEALYSDIEIARQIADSVVIIN